MAWVNNFRPSPSVPISNLYGPDPYDINWSFPVHLPTIENDVVQLTPLIPRIHAETFWARAEPAIGALSQFIPRQWATLTDYLESLEDARRDPTMVMFLVIDKTKTPEQGMSGRIAGQLALMKALVDNLTSEIGFVVILPEAQRTHVTSNAVGLLLKYALNSPTKAGAPGLGMRRVDWRAHSWNGPSIATAKRLGFQEEGTLRWYVKLPLGKDGDAPREEDRDQAKGRHTAFLAMCWDHWDAQGREHVEKQMERRA